MKNDYRHTKHSEPDFASQSHSRADMRRLFAGGDSPAVVAAAAAAVARCCSAGWRNNFYISAFWSSLWPWDRSWTTIILKLQTLRFSVQLLENIPLSSPRWAESFWKSQSWRNWTEPKKQLVQRDVSCLRLTPDSTDFSCLPSSNSSLPGVHPPLSPLALLTPHFSPSLSVCPSLSLFLSVCGSHSIVSRPGVTNGLPQSAQQLWITVKALDYK